MGGFAPRRYNDVELQIIRAIDDKLTSDDFAALKEGNAPFKIMSRADQALDEYRRRGNMPITRAEAGRQFVPQSTFQVFYQKDYMPMMNRLMAGIEVLKDRGIISDEEISAKIQEQVQKLRDAEKNLRVEGEGRG